MPAVTVIINPISGTNGRPGMARATSDLAASLVAARGLDAQVLLSERVGHARELARAAIANGSTRVLAWGGDGTVNEVASALVFSPARLGIIPSGSGNGLARELRIPLDPARAFAVALEGRECIIDGGEFDGRWFFNVAGVGIDAEVAHRFAAVGHQRRGLRRYLEIAAREFFSYRSRSYVITTDGEIHRVSALIVAIANSRQYGNGALIAPSAALDDGQLDVVIVGARSALAVLLQVPRLFTGRISRAPGVTTVKATEITITSDQPMPYHLDGEPFPGSRAITARARPGALRVAVPLDAPLDLLASR
ncbi:MAG: diacylglycerol kinase family lipid kinase [Acidobacteria bacterium]|nr:diacylglycerol kinase family lipid kinase [Acidobacteriota bacterium]